MGKIMVLAAKLAKEQAASRFRSTIHNQYRTRLAAGRFITYTFILGGELMPRMDE
jgi:hypothetical protein